MNLDTLIQILSDYRDEHGGDAEVRLMTQQNWPFENRIYGVTSGLDMNDAVEAEAEEEGEDDAQDLPVRKRHREHEWLEMPQLTRQSLG